MKKPILLMLCLCLLSACSGKAEKDIKTDPNAGLLELYEACADVRGETEAYLEKLEGMGWCAVDAKHRYDMVNWQQVDGFLKGEGGDEVRFLVLHGDGGFEAVTLSRTDIASVRVADVNGQAAVTWEKSYELERFKYTEKGWLFLMRVMPDNPQGGNHDGWEEPTLVYRIKPMDAQLREACEKYIEPLGYGTDGFFLSNWSDGNWTGLNFAGLFPCAYSVYYGKDLFYYDSPYPQAGTETRALVPAAEYEAIMLPLLDMTAEQLRAAAGFDGENYTVWTVSTLNPRFSDVFPEVTELLDNGDGTVTLTVDGVSQSLFGDSVFTHRVKVRDAEKGFAYLANTVEKKS
ncbi:MAG: DUF6070 family protein [Candidatus Heteroscillospira sp.]|jgi:hypothetical protein